MHAQKQVRATFHHNSCMQDVWIYNDQKQHTIKAPHSLCKLPHPPPPLPPSRTLRQVLFHPYTHGWTMRVIYYVKECNLLNRRSSKECTNHLLIMVQCVWSTDSPWFSRSTSFVIRPLCDFSNSDNKLQDSSKLKFCCLREENAKCPKYHSVKQLMSTRISSARSNQLKVFTSSVWRTITITLRKALWGVLNGPIEFKSARKIWLLLELLAKIRWVLACSYSQNFATARKLGFLLKFLYDKTEHVGEKCTRYDCFWKHASSFCWPFHWNWRT